MFLVTPKLTFFLVENRARQIQNLAFQKLLLGFSKGAPFEKALALIYREALSNEVNKWQPGLN
jgi:hypothetical protein